MKIVFPIKTGDQYSSHECGRTTYLSLNEFLRNTVARNCGNHLRAQDSLKYRYIADHCTHHSIPARNRHMNIQFKLAATTFRFITDQHWHHGVTDQLDAPGASGASLLGVDIAHINMPGTITSKLRTGFTPQGTISAKLLPSHSSLTPQSLQDIDKLFRNETIPSRMSHFHLDINSSQINTLIFRWFTLAYSPLITPQTYGPNNPNNPHLIIHDTAYSVDPNMLKKAIQDAANRLAEMQNLAIGWKLTAPPIAQLRHVRSTLQPHSNYMLPFDIP